MSSPETALAETKRTLAAAESIRDVRSTLSSCAPRFHDVLRRRMIVGPRPDLGIRLAKMPGRAGFTSRAGESFFVSLGSGAQTGERRFTLAHELAHTLLDAVDGEKVALGRREQEELCDLFARRALAPPRRIHAYIDMEGFPGDLDGIYRFVRTFGISLRAGIVALDEFCPDPWPVAFIAASWRLHPRGDRIEGMRVDASAADRRLFFPRHCRVATLGFTELEEWVVDTEPGDLESGTDTGLRVPSRCRGVSAWAGASAWSARSHLLPGGKPADPARGLLVCVEVAQLRRTAPSRRSGQRQQGNSIIPGQLCFH